MLVNDTNSTLTLSKFDTSLGTLTNVWVQVEVRLTNARVELDNDAATAQNGTGRVWNTANSLTSTVTLLKTDFDSINKGDLAINTTQVFALDATTGDDTDVFNATGLGDYADWQPGTLTAGDSGDIASAVWAAYQGTGNFTITVNSTFLTTATFLGSYGYFEGNTPTGALYGKVIYTYDAAPEPASLSLLALGGLALLRRRK